MVASSFALLPTDALHPHEEVEPDRVEEIVKRLREAGELLHPVVVDAETRTVLDGHHRLEALRRLDRRLTPVHLVDYRDQEVGLETWRDDRGPPTKDEVVERALEGDLLPPKTTKHLGVDDLGPVPVRLDELE